MVAGLTIDTLSATFSLYPRQNAGENKWLRKSTQDRPQRQCPCSPDSTTRRGSPSPLPASNMSRHPRYPPNKSLPSVISPSETRSSCMAGSSDSFVRLSLAAACSARATCSMTPPALVPRWANYSWSAPDVSAWSSRTFDGYHRADGQVGTRNYWLVIPLVFCENRNVEALRDAFEEELGYGRPKLYRQQVRQLIAAASSGCARNGA